MPVQTHGHEPSFSIWIARLNEPDGPYGVRFEMSDSKGILRIPRAGVFVEPPARNIGVELRLSVDQLLNARFVHLWGRGSFRQTWIFNRVEALHLEQLQVGQWVEMFGELDGGLLFLLLPEMELPSEDEAVALGEADGEDETTDPGLIREAFVANKHQDDTEDFDDIEAAEAEIIPMAGLSLSEIPPAPEAPTPTTIPIGTFRPKEARARKQLDHLETIEQLRLKIEELTRQNMALEHQVHVLSQRLGAFDAPQGDDDAELEIAPLGAPRDRRR